MQLLYLDVYFYFIFQLTNLVLCFIQPACNSFQCIFYLMNCILHFFLVLVYSSYFIFHTVVVPTQFFVVVSSLSILITILLNSVSDHLLASISFSSFTGESSIPFDCRFFLFVPLLGDSFCLFVLFLVLSFASCLCRVNFCGRNSVGLNGVVSLFSMSGCSRVSPFSICVGSVCVGFPMLGFTCWWLLCWWVLPSSRFTGIHNSHLVLYVIRGRVKVKWSKTVG